MNQNLASNSGNTSQAFDQGMREFAQSLLNEGATPQEAIGINDNMVNGMYAEAYRLYNTGKYQEASHLFRTLILINNMETKYIMGLAASFHMMKEYDNAMQIYALYCALDPHTPIPHYHIADCCLQMNNKVAALISLEMAIAQAADDPKYAVVKERSKLALQNLKQELTSQVQS